MKYLVGCGGAVTERRWTGPRTRSTSLLHVSVCAWVRVYLCTSVWAAVCACARVCTNPRARVLPCVCVWLCAAVQRAHFERTCSVGRRRRHSDDDAAVGSASVTNGTCDTVTAANGLARAGFIVAAKVVVPGTPFFPIFRRYSFLNIIFLLFEAGALLVDLQYYYYYLTAAQPVKISHNIIIYCTYDKVTKCD